MRRSEVESANGQAASRPIVLHSLVSVAAARPQERPSVGLLESRHRVVSFPVAEMGLEITVAVSRQKENSSVPSDAILMSARAAGLIAVAKSRYLAAIISGQVIVPINYVRSGRPSV